MKIREHFHRSRKQKTIHLSAAETCSWFLNGRRETKPAVNHRFKWLRKAVRKPILAEDGYPERHWTVKALLNEADCALDALDAPEDKHSRDGLPANSPYALSKKDWADSRLLGPYIPSEGAGAYHERVKLAYGVPSCAIIGINRKDIAQKENLTAKITDHPSTNEEMPEYVFLEARQMTHLPENVACDKPGIPFEIRYTGKNSKGLYGSRWYYVICVDGIVRPVKIRKTRMQFVWTGTGRHRHQIGIPSTSWVCDKMMYKGRDWGAETLTMTINFYQQIEANWYLRCSDKRGVVNMSITPGEAKHLFKDRVSMLTKTGKRKPIVHWVKSHIRVTGSNVKTHIRGNREFTWRNMDIEISLPGKHRSRFTDITTRVDPTFIKVPWYIKAFGSTVQDKYAEHKAKGATTLDGVDTTVHNPYTGEAFNVIACKDPASADRKINVVSV